MIPLMKNAFLNEFETKKALAEFILKADRLSMDAECLKFERKFAKYQGRKEAILFNSGGSAKMAMALNLTSVDNSSLVKAFSFETISKTLCKLIE